MADAEDRAPRVRLMEGQQVSLGCGTLMIIALIVMIFAGRGQDDVGDELRLLRNEIVELKTSIRSLEEAVNRDRPPAWDAD